MSHKKRISVKGLFFNDKNEILLVKGRSLHKGKEFWTSPGGGLEAKESLEEAAERELLEETGYIGKVERRIVFIQDINFNQFDGEELRGQLEIFLKGKIIDIDQSIHPDHEYKFFTQEELSEIQFLPEKLDPFSLPEGLNYYNEKIDLEFIP